MKEEKRRDTLTLVSNKTRAYPNEAFERIVAIDQDIRRLQREKLDRELQMEVDLDDSTKSLLSDLQYWRDEKALKAKKAGFTILKDIALRGIACKKPRTKWELLQVRYVGDAKVDQYGDELLEIVSKHTGLGKSSGQNVAESRKVILIKKGTPRQGRI